MDIQAEIKVNASEVSIHAPYSDLNNARFRSIGGKFKDKAWRFGNTPVVHTLIEELWGASNNLVEVLVDLDASEDLLSYRQGIMQLGGYVLAQRKARDYAATVTDGVLVQAGGFHSSGGSVKYPAVNPLDDTVLSLYVREDFALKHKLTIKQSNKQPIANAVVATEKPPIPPTSVQFQLNTIKSKKQDVIIIKDSYHDQFITDQGNAENMGQRLAETWLNETLAKIPYFQQQMLARTEQVEFSDHPLCLAWDSDEHRLTGQKFDIQELMQALQNLKLLQVTKMPLIDFQNRENGFVFYLQGVV